MKFFLRIFAHGRLRKIGLLTSISIFIISVSIIITTIVIQLGSDVPLSLQPKAHKDLINQPMQTWDQSLATNFPRDSSNYPDKTCGSLPSDWVQQENTKPSALLKNIDWKNLNLSTISGSAIWLSKTSVNCGDKIDIHASLYGSKFFDFESGLRTIEALRIGWYSGAGARQIWKSKPIKLKQYGVSKSRTATRMIETKWPTTLSIPVTQDWTPGFYLILTRSPSGVIENAAPLVVHSPRGSSKLMVMHSFITWNAYNSFGGASAYFGNGATKAEQRLDRSRVTSLDRPIVGSGGFSIHRDAVSLVQFMEQNGIAADQYSDIDIENFPSIVGKYNGVVLGGHEEYFTRRMMDSMIAARNSGINIAIFGANTAIWQTRLADSKIGKNRRIIIYRSGTEDPVTIRNKVTIKFEDQRVNYPATLFTAALASGVHVYGNLSAKVIPAWLKIPKNSSINGISPDNEVEKYSPTPAAPPKVGIIFSGILNYRDSAPVGMKPRVIPVATTLWYTTPSGSAVFNAGVMTWSCDLISTCAYSTVDENSRKVMDDVSLQVLKLWQTKGIGNTLK
jgi:hypothetical protein